MAISNVPSRLVPFPDQSGVARLLEPLFRVHERRIPAPAVRSGHSDTAFQQVHRGLVAHPAAGAHVVVAPVARARASIDEHDFKRYELMTNSAKLLLHFNRGDDMPIGKMPEIELHPGLKAPLKRYFIDGDRALALVHGRGEVIRCV